MQLLVNTVSFARVGAFALAHAGLSVAVVGMAETAAAAGFWIVILAGNVLILALEGLVVGIQTTRLMLFEFFIRFLDGGGREFSPLPPPAELAAALPADLNLRRRDMRSKRRLLTLSTLAAVAVAPLLLLRLRGFVRRSGGGQRPPSIRASLNGR